MPLFNPVDAEASTRSSADTTLQSNITAEAVARAAADVVVQNAAVKVLHSSRLDLATVGVDYETLDSYSLPAGTLAANGDCLVIESYWSSETNNTTQHRTKIGTATPLDYGANFGGGSVHIHVVITIWRTDATHGRSISANDYSGGNVYFTQEQACDLTWASGQTIVWDGKSASAAGGSKLEATKVTYIKAQ